MKITQDVHPHEITTTTLPPMALPRATSQRRLAGPPPVLLLESPERVRARTAETVQGMLGTAPKVVKAAEIKSTLLTLSGAATELERSVEKWKEAGTKKQPRIHERLDALTRRIDHATKALTQFESPHDDLTTTCARLVRAIEDAGIYGDGVTALGGKASASMEKLTESLEKLTRAIDNAGMTPPPSRDLSALWAEVAPYIETRAIQDPRSDNKVSHPFVDLRRIISEQPVLGAKLLNQVYGVFAAQFPDKNELDPVKNLKEFLTDPTQQWSMAVFLEGKEIVGGYNFRFLECPTTLADGRNVDLKVAVGEHLWVAGEKRQGRGTSFSATFDAIAEGQGAHIRVGELNDPKLMTAQEKKDDETAGISSEARVQFYRPIYQTSDDAGNLTGGKLNSPYIQPALAEGQAPVDYESMSVKVYPSFFEAFPDTPPGKLPIEVVRSAVDGYNSTMVESLATDPSARYLARLFDEYEQRERGGQKDKQVFIDILPIDGVRTFIQERVAGVTSKEITAANIEDAKQVIRACFESADDRKAGAQTYERYVAGDRNYHSDYSNADVSLLRYELFFLDGTPAGVAGLYRKNDEQDKLHLGWFGVAPEFRKTARVSVEGEGSVSEQMLEKMEERARELGAKALALFTAEDALPARKFYERTGFEQAGKFERNGERDLEFRKVL